MENNSIRKQEVRLTDVQIAEGCQRRVIKLTTKDDTVIELSVDGHEPVRVSRNEPVSVREIYESLQFSAGAKYELQGIENHGDMDEYVYKDFFGLMREIVMGLNALEPGAIQQ